MKQRFISCCLSCFIAKNLINEAKLIAFTLAETLIVMGIIGVVAALTIPNLNSSTNNMEKVTKLKKLYTNLNEVQSRATAVYGPLNTWFTSDNCSATSKECSLRYFDRILEFMKVQKTCRTTANNCASSDTSMFYFGELYNENFNDDNYVPQAVLADGSAILQIYISHPNCNINDDIGGTNTYCGFIVIDIDGPNKGKNWYGVDLFAFNITKDGIIPNHSADNIKDHIEYCTQNGIACAAWVLEKGNMDYLNVKHDGSSKCPNGTTLTWEKGSCK